MNEIKQSYINLELNINPEKIEKQISQPVRHLSLKRITFDVKSKPKLSEKNVSGNTIEM